MQLTRFSDLGLRVLMYLAHGARTQPVTIAEIASQFDVPHNHLVKVVGRLSKLGWVAAARGRNGGLRLGVPGGSLRLGVVLRELEGDRPIVNCDNGPCALQGNCIVHGALRVALDAFYAALDRYTLNDAVARRTGQVIVQMHRDFLSVAGASKQPEHFA